MIQILGTSTVTRRESEVFAFPSYTEVHVNSQSASGVYVKESSRKSRGCLFWFLTFVVLISLAIGGLVYYSRHKFQDFVSGYTADSPVPIGQVTLTPLEQEGVRTNVKAFLDSAAQGQAASPLEIRGQEITPALEAAFGYDFNKRLYAVIEDGKIKTEISSPLDFEPANALGLASRYLNAKAEFSASMSNGRLNVFLESLAIAGLELPSDEIGAFKQENLGKNLNLQHNGTAFAEAIEKMEIQGDTMRIVPRVK